MWISYSRLAGSCIVFLLACSPAQAESIHAETTEGQSISLDQAIANTLTGNPHLRAYGFQLEIEQGRVQQAGLAPNPDLNFSLEDAMGTGIYQGFSNAEATISLAWVFERGIRERRVIAAQASQSLTAVDIEILRVDVAAETARRYLLVLANQAMSKTAVAAVELAEMVVEAVQQRVSAGRSPKADLARAETELAYATLALDDIEHELKTARHQLAAQWGVTEPEFVEVLGDPYHLPESVSLQVLQQQAEQNPELSRYLVKQRLDEAELQLAEAQAKPAWKGTMGLRRYESTDDFALVTGFSIPLTLRNRNQGNIAEAHAVIERTLAATTATRVDIETALYVHYEAMQHSLHRANNLRSEVLPRIEFALAETQSAYQLGRYSYLDLQIVQAELIVSQNALIDASIDAHRNVIEIERLTGVRFTPTEITP